MTSKITLPSTAIATRYSTRYSNFLLLLDSKSKTTTRRGLVRTGLSRWSPTPITVGLNTRSLRCGAWRLGFQPLTHQSSPGARPTLYFYSALFLAVHRCVLPSCAAASLFVRFWKSVWDARGYFGILQSLRGALDHILYSTSSWFICRGKPIPQPRRLVLPDSDLAAAGWELIRRLVFCIRKSCAAAN